MVEQLPSRTFHRVPPELTNHSRHYSLPCLKLQYTHIYISGSQVLQKTLLWLKVCTVNYCHKSKLQLTVHFIGAKTCRISSAKSILQTHTYKCLYYVDGHSGTKTLKAEWTYGLNDKGGGKRP